MYICTSKPQTMSGFTSENELLNMEIASHVRDEEEDDRDFGDEADEAYEWDKEDRLNPED